MPERAVALARGRGHRGHAPAQQRDAPPRARRSRSCSPTAAAIVLGRDAELAQAALDPLGAPGVEPAPVVGEALRERRVVDEAALEQLADDDVRLLGRDALARPGCRAARARCARAGSARARPAARARSSRAAGSAGARRRDPRRGRRHPQRGRARAAGSTTTPRGPSCHRRRARPRRPRRRPPRARSASRGPGRCRARRRSWTRSPWRPRRARPGSALALLRPWPSRSSP